MAKKKATPKPTAKKSHMVVSKTKAPARPASKSTIKGGLKGFSKPSAH